MNEGSQYVVITPARNEQDNIGHTIRSMAAQTHRPLCWVIVNDGSTDETGAMIDAAAREHSWILAVHRKDRGSRRPGAGVIEAFYDGCALLNETNPLLLDRGEGSRVRSRDSAVAFSPRATPHAQPTWDFLVKFDADLSFTPDYFERCLEKFSEDPKLGLGGGMISQEVAGQLVCESPGDPAFHVRGATKIYRRACWEAIGGLIHAPGWDTVDELKANMLGWTTLTFRDIPLRHHRFTGTADGVWRNYVKFGLANYITGYHPLFMLVKCLSRSVKKPYLMGAIGLWWGFCRGYVKRVKQVADPEFIRYVRRQQINRLLFRPSIWNY
jgi:poly-beta-1,6-N-acetyl-D-glucosamine synthase